MDTHVRHARCVLSQEVSPVLGLSSSDPLPAAIVYPLGEYVLRDGRYPKLLVHLLLPRIHHLSIRA